MTHEGRRFAAVAAWLAVLACAAGAWADVFWVGSGAGRGFRQEVDVIGVERGDLVYLVNGNRGTTPLARIQQIELEGETGLNTAEQAFSAGDWAKASAGYLTAARRHPKEWVRRRAAADPHHVGPRARGAREERHERNQRGELSGFILHPSAFVLSSNAGGGTRTPTSFDART